GLDGLPESVDHVYGVDGSRSRVCGGRDEKERAMKAIERREFVKTLAAAGVAIAVPHARRTTHNARRLDKVGIQLYTVRDQMKADFEGTLAHVAEIGYKEVEFAGYFDHTPADVRAILDRHGLSAPSTHIALGEIDAWK